MSKLPEDPSLLSITSTSYPTTAVPNIFPSVRRGTSLELLLDVGCRVQQRAETAFHQRCTSTTRYRAPQRTQQQVSMPPRWHHPLALAAMAVALLSASANLEQNQQALAESQFQPKKVLEALSDAQHSMLADLEEYRNSTKGTRGGGSSTETMTTSRCECIHGRVTAVVFG